MDRRFLGLVIALATGFAAMAATPSQPAGAQDARRFIARLYERYSDPRTQYLGRDAPAAFSPQLLRLIRRDQARTPKGEVGILDWDPICACQDPDGLRVLRVDLQPGSPVALTATVKLGFVGGEKATVRLDLARRSGVWRIADIHTQETPSLVHLLQGER
jgi:hypothetical protein